MAKPPIVLVRFVVATALAVLLQLTSSRADNRAEELRYLKTILPEHLLSVSKLEIASRRNITINGNGLKTHLGLGLLAGQALVNDGVRAEVSVDYPFKPDETVSYFWRFMLAPDFKLDRPENRWWHIAQWHDQPDRSRHQNWDTFQSNSPTISLSIGEVGDRSGIAVSYGKTDDDHLQIQKGPVFLERGQWHDARMDITWSQTKDGAAIFYLDGHPSPVFSLRGANMNNGFQHYMKLGMYRHPAIKTENWIYLNSINISSRKD